jgi:uncharacterized membrane protein
MEKIPEYLNGPLAEYQHDHPPVRDINALYTEALSPGQRVADKLTALVGSWPFILGQSVLLVLWIVFNIYFALHPRQWKAFDPYPFILLNLMLSFQAAYTGPIVMMSQNRQADKDRLVVQSDFECNQTAEKEIRLLMDHLQYQDKMMAEIVARLEALQGKPTG